MANYILQARSNYFRVEDPKRFERWCRYFGLTFWSEKKLVDSPDLFYAIAADDDCGWPSHHPEADIGIDFEEELRKHLDPRDVAVLMQTGAEGLRFISGYATPSMPTAAVSSSA